MRSALPLAVVGLLSWPALADETAGAPAPSRTEATFGKGATFMSGDERFTLQMRARAQLRYTATREDEGDGVTNEFVVRRLRLLFRGRFFDPTLEYYIQLGLSYQDMEPDRLVPVRDAYVTWSPLRDLNFRFGQMKVPFALQRRVSSGSMQFPDRSLVMSELNLDRDTGMTLFSNDLFGLGSRLGYQLGVFGGDGRNRTFADAGVLTVARLQFKPFGGFDELVEGGFERAEAPKLMVGAAAAYNAGTRRSQSTIGDVYTHARFDYTHLEADGTFRWKGLTLQAEWLYRRADKNEVATTLDDGSVLKELSRSAWGAYVQGGYAWSEHAELVARYGELHPLDAAAGNAAKLRQKELGVGLNWYGQGHDFKVQSDLFRVSGDELFADGEWRFRSQMQFWF